jgi:predicted amidohydrolase YtcJ
MSRDGKTRLSRRNLLKAAAAGVAALGAPLPAAAHGNDRNDRNGGGDDSERDLVFVNGRIHTMDDSSSVVRAAAMRRGKFVAVGRDAENPARDAKVIDLRGRTVVPGLIESHTHFISLANRPGYHVAGLELAGNIAEVQAMLAARRPDVPAGQFITALGGWNPRQWTEQRQPTLTELDAAVPDRPVFLLQTFSGPSRTNSLGKAFFESAVSPLAGPVVVAADGTITSGLQTTTALYHLRVRQTFEDKRRSALDAMAHSARVGLTTNLDQVLPPAPGPLLPTQALSGLDHYRMYDAWLSLHREDKAYVRVQTNFLHNQGNIAALGALENQLPELRQRLLNQFPFFGNDMMRTGGIGEWASPLALPAANPANYAVWYEAQRLVAQARWRNENAQTGLAQIQQVVETYEAMDLEFGIKELRWGLQHCDQATADQIARLKALNCGVSMSGFRWLGSNPTPTGAPVGPNFPMIVASGIPAGMHEDGVHIAPHNPWFALHYAVTGLNVLGQQINLGQQITRQQALHAYTRGNAWYLNREDDLGSIEEGKFADLVVLDKDYFTVTPEQMRTVRPIMTVIAGKIVHDTGALRGRRDWDHDHDHCHDNDHHGHERR